jgi:hypothetical protein
MAWKTDENGALVVSEGNPVWIYESGPEKDKEAVVEFGKTLNTISSITKESISRKDKLNELKAITTKLEAAGIEDIDSWLEQSKKALETVGNLSDKEILDAGEVDKIKKSLTDGYTKQIEALRQAAEKTASELKAKLEAKDSSIKNLVVRGAFDASDFLKEKTVLLPDFAYAQMGGSFDVEEVDGTFVGYARDREGNKLMSIQRPGEVASPLEAIEILINEHPQKDRILKMEANGGGTRKPGDNTSASGLVAQYTQAKAAGDFNGMIAIKGQMAAAGMKVPL